jgi:hypothetical protein
MDKRRSLIKHLRDHHDGTVETLAYGEHNHPHSHGLIISDEELARTKGKKRVWTLPALEDLHASLDAVAPSSPLRTAGS